MKQSTILEKVALVKRIQEMAGKVIEENGGHDIKFNPAEEDNGKDMHGDKTYVVLHQYDVDGGFGDAVSVKERICSFNNRTDAEKFVEKYGCEHTYDHPYEYLYCGKLAIIEEETTTFEEAEKLIEDAWWKKNGE